MKKKTQDLGTTLKSRDHVKQSIRNFLAKCCPKKLLMDKNEQKNVQIPEQLLLLQLQKQIQSICQKLTKDDRMQKAVRHFYDAYFLRTPRNDIEGENKKYSRQIWLIINHPIWNNFLWSLALLYQLIVFWEPQYHGTDYNDNYLTLLIIESLILYFVILDTIINFILMIQTSRNYNKLLVIFKSKKLFFKVFFTFILLLDFVINIITYPKIMVRFGRSFRALLFVSYSKDLRRYIKGVMMSLQVLIILFIFYFLIISMWAFIGKNLLGHIDEELELNHQVITYDDFFQFSFILYISSTSDFFPDIAFPAMMESKFYVIYFILFLILFLMLFNPIPQALVYESFSKQRKKIQERDKQRQRLSIQMCYFSLVDEQSAVITYQKAFLFLRQAYGNRINQYDVDEFLQLLDFDDSRTFSLDEFYVALKLCSRFPKYQLDRLAGLSFWENFRNLMNNKYKLIEIVEGFYFNITLTLIILLNCLLILIGMSIEDQNSLEVIDVLEILFFSIYVLETVMKIVGLGFQDYFKDIWNKFDFIILLVQIFCDFIIINAISDNIKSSVKANRIVRLTKLQKIFRLFKIIRGVKIFTVVLQNLSILSQVNLLMYRIVLCVPVVLRFCLVFWVLFYCYAVIGVEFLNSNNLNQNDQSQNPYFLMDCSNLENKNIQWGNCKFADFDTVGMALLLLFQTFTTNWATTVINYSHDLGDYWLVSLYLGSFVLITTFLYALISGLVWEIFNAVDEKVDNEFELYLERKRQEFLKLLQYKDKIKKQNDLSSTDMYSYPEFE